MEEFKTILAGSCFILDLAATTKEEAIEEMVNALVQAGKINRKDEVLAALLERERKMSTGMSAELAIPHAKTNAVNEMLAVFARKKNGIDFNSLDGKPSRIFVMTISPLTGAERYVRYLGNMGKLLKNEEVRQKVLNASSKEEIIDILTK